jgi:hypothetical protein
MRPARVLLGFTMAMAIANGALAQKVTIDYDRRADFGQYKTFSWMKEPSSGNPLIRARVIEDINSALSGKGLQLVTSNADLCIAAHVVTEQDRTLNTFYDGFGDGWRGGGFGSATTGVSTYEVGTLVLDIFDARTREAIWRGTSSKTLSGNPEKHADRLNKAIARMLKNFPPPSLTWDSAVIR